MLVMKKRFSMRERYFTRVKESMAKRIAIRRRMDKRDVTAEMRRMTAKHTPIADSTKRTPLQGIRRPRPRDSTHSPSTARLSRTRKLSSRRDARRPTLFCMNAWPKRRSVEQPIASVLSTALQTGRGVPSASRFLSLFRRTNRSLNNFHLEHLKSWLSRK